MSTVMDAPSRREIITERKPAYENLVPLGFSQDQRILVPISEGNDSRTRELIQYAISLSRRYSMKITLLAAIPEIEVAEGYKSFARAEGVLDYEYYYAESIAASILGKWEQILEEQGVEYDTLTITGSLTDAVREAVSTHNIGLVVVRPNGNRRSLLNRILHPTFLGAIPFKASTESHTPVLVIS